MKRVNRKRPCQICRRGDWCYTSDDGSLAFCMRSAAGSFKRASNGAFVHRLAEASAPPRAPERQPARQVERASVERRHAVYSTLLRLSPLRDANRRGLRERGLDDSEIRRNCYGSTPSPAVAESVARALAPHDLRGVPGFYETRGGWQMVKARPGFFVPYRDARGQIQALQYRLDEPLGGTKYLWLSSRDCSSGAPAHFAYGHLLGDAREVLVTEGGLKADVIAFLTGAPVVGVAGVSCFGADFAARLNRAAPRLQTAIIAYDRDLHTNPAVRRALDVLAAQLEAARLRVRVRAWPGPEKGYDDYLLAQSRGADRRAA